MKVVDPMSQAEKHQNKEGKEKEEKKREQVKGRKSFSLAADELISLEDVEKEKVIPNREGETTTLPSPTLLESEPDCPVSPPRADLFFFTVSHDQGTNFNELPYFF